MAMPRPKYRSREEVEAIKKSQWYKEKVAKGELQPIPELESPNNHSH